MNARFAELDRCETPLGELVLRRRLEPSLHVDVYEVKLGDEFLMSSLFTVSETRLAELGLAALSETDAPIDVVVGGLGLGFTARAVLRDPRVRSVHVVEALDEVIGWHERNLLPFAAEVNTDPRCHLVHGDFFAIVAGDEAFGLSVPDRVHAVLVDIDHTPRHHLHPSHAAFYEPAGLHRLERRLHPGGVFGLWSDAAPDDDFLAVMREVFASCAAHVVTFSNPITDGESSSTVYVATAL